MITRLTCRQVDHVLAGRDVIGRPYGTPVSCTKNACRRLHLYVWIQNAFHDRPGRLTVAQRTELIRKFAAYLTRNKTRNGLHMADAMTFLLARPHLLTTKLSFGSAITLAHEQQRRAENAHTRSSTAMVLRDSDTPAPRCPVVATHGAFTLHQLIHPLHIRDVGAFAGNCLSVRAGTGEIANRVYWKPLKEKRLALFALHHGDAPCFILCITGNRISEWQTLTTPPGLTDALHHCVAAITPPLPPEQTATLVHRIVAFMSRPGELLPKSAPQTAHLAAPIERALEGHIAGGSCFKPLRFNRDTAAMASLRATLGYFMQFTTRATPDDITRFARKLAVYLIRHPSPDPDTLIHGAAYFSTNLNAIRSKLSFAGAARLQGVMWRAFHNRHRRHLKAELKAQLALPFTAPELLLEHDGYRLTMLTHPRHLVDLAVKTNTKRLIAWIDGRPYPHRAYSHQMLSGYRRFFALSRHNEFCVWFTSIDTEITEMHFTTPREELFDIMARCVSAVEKITGYIVYAAGIWPRPEHECLPFGNRATPHNWIPPRTQGAGP